MSRALPPEQVAALAQTACLLEVNAEKPGNVTPRHDFHDTRFEDFLLSAAAVGEAFLHVHEAGVGETVLRAISDTRRVVSVNTNLGMVLLLAPLALAAGRDGGAFADRVERALAESTVADAKAVYAAIRLVSPGGLGRAEAEDVSREPSLTLRQAMALAASRDQVASEYATGYDVTFARTLPALRVARGRGAPWPEAIVEAFLAVLADVPDTLIARKEGLAAAREVSTRAQAVLDAGAPGTRERASATQAFDASLRGPGNRLNPGTTADLVAAAIFVALAEDASNT